MVAVLFALLLPSSPHVKAKAAAPVPDITAPTCPLAAPADRVVACPGWKTRTCREHKVRDTFRSSSTKSEFLNRYGFKGTSRKGYVLDHLFPLACGGCDVPWNLQFQTKPEGKQKDLWERKVCAPATTANDEEE